jgi:hypothetical protein
MKATAIKERLSGVTVEDVRRPYIPVVHDNSAEAILNDDIRHILGSLIQFLQRDAVEHLVRVHEIEVRGIVDPEDGATQLMVRIWTLGLSEDEDFDYFRAVCQRLSAWRNTLNDGQDELFALNFILQSRCTENA